MSLCFRQGGYQHKPNLPFTPGQEAAGIVTRTGDGVDNVNVGDRVQCGGGMASSIVTSASSCWKIPDHYSFLEGATFSTGYATAYHCLIERGQLQAGETILVHGATGGMGMAAVHIAKAVGATVIATGGSDDKLEIVSAQGCVCVSHILPSMRSALDTPVLPSCTNASAFKLHSG